MRHWYDVVQDPTGKGISGATVTVNVHGGSAATIYSDDGVTPISNPISTDSLGRFNFYVADGRYDLVVSSAGASFTQTDVEIADVTQANTGDAVWNVNPGGLIGATLLNQQVAGNNITGNGADQNIYTYTIPANTVSAGKGIRIFCVWNHQGVTATTYKLKFGSTLIESFIKNDLNLSSVEYYFFNNSGSQIVQNWTRSVNFFGLASLAVGTGAINFVNSQIVAVTFNVASPDTVAPQFFSVQIIS